MTHRNTTSRTGLLALAATVAAALPAVPANAAFVDSSTGNPSAAPFFQGYSWTGYNDHTTGTPGFTIADGTITSNNTGIAGLSMNSTYTLNGATVTATATTTPGGFYTSRNTATLSITNANSQDQYYAIGGYGTMTTARFFTPQALADRATFTWRVSGLESTVPAGACNPATQTFDLCATSRIDFAATAAPNQNFYDLLYGGNANTMTRFGAGTYTYDISGLPLDQTISFALWTSAFVQVNPGQLAQGGSYSFFSNYGSTYELAAIDLFDAAGERITDWTLIDDVTGTTVFTSSGRIDPTAVPEPGTLALLGAALVGVGLVRRRRPSVGLVA